MFTVSTSIGGFIMNILLVSDRYNNSKDILQESLIGNLKDNYHNVKTYFLKEDDLKPCIGCFNCWIKTPNLCIINDLARDIGKAVPSSDLFIIISEIRYGCYSPTIKKVLDRNINSILPFFKITNGEMHHAPRYSKYPNIIVLGYGNDITSEEEKTLTSLANANAINLQTQEAKTYICRDENNVDSIIDNMLRYIASIGGER